VKLPLLQRLDLRFNGIEVNKTAALGPKLAEIVL
jgi:hypothetical protein